MVGVAKTQPIDEELQGSHVVPGEEHDVVDRLRNRSLPPLAMQVEPLDVAGRVDRVRLTNNGPLSPYAQAQGHAVVRKKTRRTVGVATDFTIDGETRHQLLQRFRRIDAPNRLMHPRFSAVRRRQTRITAAPHHDLRPARYFEYAFVPTP